MKRWAIAGGFVAGVVGAVVLALSSGTGALGSGAIGGGGGGGGNVTASTMSGTAVTCASGAGVSTLTLDPACAGPNGVVVVPIINNDVDGCTVTVSEASARLGCTALLALSSSAGGTVTVAAVSNVFVPDGSWTPTVGDSLVMTYTDLSNDAWVESSRHTTNSILTTAGVTTTATVTFSGVATDITTAGSEDLMLAPAGTGSVVLSPGDKNVDLTNASGTGRIDNNTSAVTFFFGPSIGGVGSVADRALGQTAAGFYDNAGFALLLAADGVGIIHHVTAVTANNNLSGTATCSNSGNVGDEVVYSDTGSSKISFCVCEQTAAATFAWGAVTATGDCT